MNVNFHRGPDRLPRGPVKSLYRALLDDDGALTRELLAAGFDANGTPTVLPPRAAIGLGIVLGLNHRDPRVRMEVAEQLADRLEGRPVQQIEARPPRRTIFYKEGEPVPPGVVVDLPTQAQREDEIATAKRSIAAAALETLDDDDVPPVDGYPTATGHRR